ncbi:hypothetical protein, partial [Deinococcus marmoris]
MQKGQQYAVQDSQSLRSLAQSVTIFMEDRVTPMVAPILDTPVLSPDVLGFPCCEQRAAHGKPHLMGHAPISVRDLMLPTNQGL